MKAKHTPGLCLVDLEGIPSVQIGEETWGLKGMDPDEYTEGNAKRLAGCWNACKGINPEAVPDLLEALEEAEAMFSGLGIGIANEHNQKTLGKIRTAISKAKGQQ